MKGYTTQTKIESYTLLSLSEFSTTQIVLWIEAIEKYIDKYTGRSFIADASPSERLYEVDFTRTDFPTRQRCDLIVDDFVGTISLSIDSEAVDDAAYKIYPANEETKNRIHLTADEGVVFTFGEQNISVTAKWGSFASLPADIEFAATVLASGIIINAKKEPGTIRQESLGGYSVSFDTQSNWKDFERAKEILDSYTKMSA